MSPLFTLRPPASKAVLEQMRMRLCLEWSSEASPPAASSELSCEQRRTAPRLMACALDTITYGLRIPVSRCGSPAADARGGLLLGKLHEPTLAEGSGSLSTSSHAQ